MTIQQRINELKKQKNAIVLAHYYQTDDIIDIADMVGDSYGLSKQAKDTDADIIVFCGVRFMAESAKLLSPQKKVLLPVPDAGCPMADMAAPEDIRGLRAKYPDAAVVCYVNSTAEVKAQCDVCVTSSNAVKVVRSLREKQIIFVPDQHLAGYVASMVPEKEIIPFNGYCIVHHRMSTDDVDRAKEQHPEALLLVHPECPEPVVKRADFVGSTAAIIDFATKSTHSQFIIGTEQGVMHILKKQNPDKAFYLLSDNLLCKNMKKTKLTDVLDALEYEQYEMTLDESIMEAAKLSLERMLAV